MAAMAMGADEPAALVAPADAEPITEAAKPALPSKKTLPSPEMQQAVEATAAAAAGGENAPVQSV
tara:strand:- start:645 stop:839 length:195 start_codon:yes stop_codon:yes gene_type:complete